jgi:integrase
LDWRTSREGFHPGTPRRRVGADLLHRWLDHAEEQLTATTVREHRPGRGVRRVAARLAATGARRGEVCGLRWSDVHVDSSTVSIRRSVASVAGGTIVKDTKTHAARRIAIDADTMAVLARHRRRMEVRARAFAVDFGADGFVFTSTGDGSEPLHPDTVTGGFRRVCDRIGLAGARLHDLRHLHAPSSSLRACRCER